MDFFELKVLLRTLILPPASPLILAVVGLGLTRSLRMRTIGKVLCISGVASLWLLSTPVVSGQLMKLATHHPALDLSQPAPGQAVVILAGGVRRYSPEYNDDSPNEITLQRLAYGARVARINALPVLVTGGREEARVMNDFLIADFGITPRWVEDSALDTRDNALYSSELLKRDGIGTIVLVTSALHMSRAVKEFRAQGMEVVAAPVSHYSPTEGLISRWVPGIAGLRDSRNSLYEIFANVVYELTSE
jgi:uncharacterized SAM-binding protein YcdF (DUF218 family)